MKLKYWVSKFERDSAAEPLYFSSQKKHISIMYCNITTVLICKKEENNDVKFFSASTQVAYQNWHLPFNLKWTTYKSISEAFKFILG